LFKSIQKEPLNVKLKRMSWIFKFVESLFTATSNSSENATDSLATSTYRTYYKSINVNAYKSNSSSNESSGGGSYYLAGVLFMLSVIGLLLYVNLYYENCFRDTCFQLSKYRACFFLRYLFVTVSVAASQTSTRLNQKKLDDSNIVDEQATRLNIAATDTNTSKDEHIYKVYV
jgi:hypothetical protein